MMTAHPLAATLAQQREMIAAAGRKAETQGGYLTACETALRFVQSPELAAALAALPGGGVKVLCHRLHQPNHSSAWISGDYSGPETKQRGWSVERAYSLPAPNHHEADRNG